MNEAIVVDRLTRTFGSFVAVREVSFHVERGEIFGYLGANGAGKSTTIRMLCGLLEPSGGRALVNDIDVAEDPEGVKRSLGYMSQKFSLYPDLTVEENLQFFGGAYGLSGRTVSLRIDEALERVDLLKQRELMTRSLSGGLRQRLALASSLLHRPAILFLDEPTAGVDPSARRNFWSLIRRLAASGTTIFVTTHYMDEAEYCHRIGLMVDGKLVALDTPAELKKKHVPGAIAKIRGKNVASALAAAKSFAGVYEAQPFGASAHVRFDPAKLDLATLRQSLATVLGDSSHLSIEAIEPNLEDVFLAVAQRTVHA